MSYEERLVYAILETVFPSEDNQWYEKVKEKASEKSVQVKRHPQGIQVYVNRGRGSNRGKTGQWTGPDLSGWELLLHSDFPNT